MTAVFPSPPEPGIKPVYPFAEWLNGHSWTLTRGRDYWGDVDAFVASIQGSARARRKNVDITLINDGRWIKIQAVDRA